MRTIMADELSVTPARYGASSERSRKLFPVPPRSRHDWRPSAPCSAGDGRSRPGCRRNSAVPRKRGVWAKGSQTGFCTEIRRGLFPFAPWCCPLVQPHLSTTTLRGVWWVHVGEQDEEIYEAATPVGPDDVLPIDTRYQKTHQRWILLRFNPSERRHPPGRHHQRRSFHLPSPTGQ